MIELSRYKVSLNRQHDYMNALSFPLDYRFSRLFWPEKGASFKKRTIKKDFLLSIYSRYRFEPIYLKFCMHEDEWQKAFEIDHSWFGNLFITYFITLQCYFCVSI